jgi:hypothetical protein
VLERTPVPVLNPSVGTITISDVSVYPVRTADPAVPTGFPFIGVDAGYSDTGEGLESWSRVPPDGAVPVYPDGRGISALPGAALSVGRDPESPDQIMEPRPPNPELLVDCGGYSDKAELAA